LATLSEPHVRPAPAPVSMRDHFSRLFADYAQMSLAHTRVRSS
jgi:hypothetical protein